MVRERLPNQDDDAIMRLVIAELIPKSHNPKHFEHIHTDLPLRLKYGTTYVETDQHNRLIGFIHILALRGGILLIDLLAVKSTAKRSGVGSRLLAQAEYAGRSRRCHKSILLFDLGNDQARHFYERAGYHVTRYLPDYKCYEMEKTIQ